MKKTVHNTFLQGLRMALPVGILVALALCISSFNTGNIWEPASNVNVVKCYPNPAISYVNFEFPQEIDKSYTLFIYSFVGRKMAELPINNRKLVVTLNDYFRGIYIYQLRDRTGKIIETGKFQVEQ